MRLALCFLCGLPYDCFAIHTTEWSFYYFFLWAQLPVLNSVSLPCCLSRHFKIFVFSFTFTIFQVFFHRSQSITISFLYDVFMQSPGYHEALVAAPFNKLPHFYVVGALKLNFSVIYLFYLFTSFCFRGTLSLSTMWSVLHSNALIAVPCSTSSKQNLRVNPDLFRFWWV